MSDLQLAETTSLRNADLAQMTALLQQQADLRYDVVVAQSELRYDGGLLRVKGGAVEITDDGITSRDAVLRPTSICEGGVAEKFGIPVVYLRRIREQGLRVPTGPVHVPGVEGLPPLPEVDAGLLLDATVNAHLAADPGKKVLVRAWRTDDPDAEGVARAFLSDRYSLVDNYDVLLAALDGIRAAGVNVQIDGCDLTERRMRVRVVAPEIQALAPVLLRNYKNPFGDGGIERLRQQIDDVHARRGGDDGRGSYEPGTEPVVFAGFELSNSETGGGAFTITPRLVIQICRNGLTINADALREIHLGGRLEAGVVEWSGETQRKSVELVTAKARDAVASFLDADYVAKKIAAIEEKSDAKVKEPQKVIERVAKSYSFSEGEQQSILAAFIASGDLTAGGVMNAVTAAAQTVADAERAAELEASALGVLDEAHALARA